ncbi:MAG TPA: zf-HC2 domain-containing protein, partial [Mycobacteriales bacterium]|nr:zf-HC2 domain-containing protein [Mycobacteriales bacterium]
MSCERGPDLAAYVLGALEPTDRVGLERHLAGCQSCRQELTELAGLPGLLGRLTAAEAERSLPQPAPEGLDRLLARAAAHRSRQRVRRRHRLLAVAAVVVLAGAGAGIGVAVQPGSTPSRVVTATQGDVHATARLRPAAGGTAVELRLSGVDAGEHCQLVAVGRAGQRADAGSWVASYDGAAGIRGVTAI